VSLRRAGRLAGLHLDSISRELKSAPMSGGEMKIGTGTRD
jgi:hypothetical protein